jgi:hypothetical protein
MHKLFTINIQKKNAKSKQKQSLQAGLVLLECYWASDIVLKMELNK